MGASRRLADAYFVDCLASLLQLSLYNGKAGGYTVGMIYDVSLPLSPELVGWPGDPPAEVTPIAVEGVRISRWVLSSHAGTHVDAPAHFFAGRATVDQINPAVLIGPCRVLDLPDVSLVTDDVLALYDFTGVERLLLRTRNSLFWQRNCTTFDREFVALDSSAARTLLDAGVILLGVDGLSVDPYASNGEVHDLLLEAGVIIIEGLSLAQVPAGDYQLLCAPLKLVGGDGAPARVFLQG